MNQLCFIKNINLHERKMHADSGIIRRMRSFTNNLIRMNLTKYLAILLVFILSSLSLQAQNTENVATPKDKKKIELRPSSRDYGPVVRDNSGQRIDRDRDKNKFVKKRPVVKRKLTKPDNQKEIKRDQRLLRRQRVLQRRSLNR
jgi:hypothetical protein